MIFWLAIACLPTLSFQTVVTISNRDPRRDNTGKIMDCHDGNILRAEDMYWLYCMAYGPCHNTHCATATCGGRIDHNVSIYRSKNLTSGSWEYVADLLPVEHRLSGTYYRPKTVFNPNTNQYVFWINVLPRPSASSPPDFSKSSYLVATSPAPEGPFTVVNTNATTRHGEGGDFSLFVDDDHTGYIIYTSLSSNHAISIAPLTPNFTESIPAQNTAFLPGTTGGCFEAPAMFKRKGIYFALLGPCCCFCAGGAENFIYTSSHPLGPYTRLGSLGNAEHAQQNYVFKVPVISGEEVYVWTGDRWKSTPDGQKGHDFQFWQPLNFSTTPPPPPGRFVRCNECSDPDPVYWQVGDVLHHLHACGMCGRNLCSDYEDISPSEKAKCKLGVEFTCDMLQSSVIRPLMSVDALPSFNLDLAP